MTKATNLRKKEIGKKQKVVTRQKAQDIVKKHQKNTGKNSLSIENDEYHNNNIYDTNLD